MARIDIGKRLAGAFPDKDIRLPSVKIDPSEIRAVLINEVVPRDPGDDFYGGKAEPFYLTTTIPLFRKAGAEVTSIRDILNLGVYITNAVKCPKGGHAVDAEALDRSCPVLEAELDLFPHLRVVMLMGDVAKKAFNRIAKKRTGKNAVPSGATYRIRSSQHFYGDIRVFPSYIMTGGNILIEKSKVKMAAEDLAAALSIIG